VRGYAAALQLPAALLAAALTLAAAIAPPMAAAETPVQVQVQLEPEVIGLDDTTTLTITAESGGISSLSFQPKFVLDNLEIAGYPSQSEQVALLNGTLSRSFRYSLPLRPMAIGTAHVRALVVNVRGQLMRLADQEISIQEQPAGAAPGPSGGAMGGAGNLPGIAGGRRGAPPPGLPSPQDLFNQLFGGRRPTLGEAPPAQGPAAFLRAEVLPSKPLAGEQALYTLYLYTRQDIAGINSTAMPTFQGFWVRDVPQPERLVPEMVAVGTERYARVPILRKALFALRPGPHVLEPAGCDVVIEPIARNFFGPTLASPEELHLGTPALTVDVRPLPFSPPGFSGVIGQVSLAAKLQPYTLLPGQAATLTVTLAGTGNLQGVAAPRLDLPPAITAFPPQQQSDDRLDGTTVRGRRTWTYVLIANRPGRYNLRPHPVTYFDPARREYRLADSPPLALAALAPPAAPPALPAHGATPPARHAASPHQSPFSFAGLAGLFRSIGPANPANPARPSDPSDPSDPSYWSLWLRLAVRRFDLGLLLTVAVLLTLVLVLRRRYRQSPALAHGLAAISGASGASGASTVSPPFAAGHPSSRDAGASLADLEKKLKEAAREDRPRHAATLVEEGWRGLLAARWGVPATTPPPRWGAALAAHGAPPDLADDMLHLSEELHYLRYAPQLSTTSAVRDEVLSRSRQLLRRLR
jgi:hypothetical protein